MAPTPTSGNAFIWEPDVCDQWLGMWEDTGSPGPLAVAEQFPLWMWVWGRGSLNLVVLQPPENPSAVMDPRCRNAWVKTQHNGVHQAGHWTDAADMSEDAGQGAKPSGA